MKISPLFKEVFYTLLASQVFLSYGSEQRYLSFLLHTGQLKDEQLEYSIYYIAFPLGCIISGILMDMFGRKPYFIITFILKIISWFYISAETSRTMLLGGMFILGITQGMRFACFTYIAEIALPSRRGLLLALLFVSHALGEIDSTDLLLKMDVPWNSLGWLYVLDSILSVLTMLLLPESPLWLLNKGRDKAAIETLSALRCSNNIFGIWPELEDMRKSIVKKGSASLVEIIKNMLGAWEPLLIAIGFQFLFLVIRELLLLGEVLMYNIRFIPWENHSLMFEIEYLYSLTKWIGIIIVPLLMQAVNHRIHLMLVVSAMAICAIGTRVYISTVHIHRTFNESFMYGLPFAFGIRFAYYAGVMPFAYTIGSELYPCKVSGIMTGIFFMFWHLCEAKIGIFFPFGIFGFFGNHFSFGVNFETVSEIAQWGFSVTAFCAFFILFVKYILPETKGKTLNQVQQQYFQKKPAVIQIGNIQLDRV